MDTHPASTPADRLLFEAVVRPHRSLSRRGVFMVVGFMLTGSLVVTSLMALLGAWPVIGFNGADLMLAVFLLWLNVRAARAVEVIRLSQSGLLVSRTDQRGRHASVTLAPYWLNAVLQERPGTVPRLVLSALGRDVEVARQLGEAEKRDLAAALARALDRWCNPRFDNPQLRQ